MEMVKGEPTPGVIDTLPKGHKVWAGSFISNTLDPTVWDHVYIQGLSL